MGQLTGYEIELLGGDVIHIGLPDGTDYFMTLEVYERMIDEMRVVPADPAEQERADLATSYLQWKLRTELQALKDGV